MAKKRTDALTVRSGAAEYLTYVAATGEDKSSIEMRYENPESVKLGFQITLGRQRCVAKASNFPKNVTNSEKRRKKPVSSTGDIFTYSVVESMRSQNAARFS